MIRAGWLGVIFSDEFGKSEQDQTRSGLAGWGVIFRDEFGKSGQDQGMTIMIDDRDHHDDR